MKEKCKHCKCDTFGGTHEWVIYCELTMSECDGYKKDCNLQGDKE